MNGMACANKMIDGLCELTDLMSAQERQKLAKRLYNASKTMSPKTWEECDTDFRYYRDQNEQRLVEALENAGATVIRLESGYATGTPDLLVGHSGKNYLIEVKTMQGKNSVFQAHFAKYWEGQVTQARSISELAEALDLPYEIFDDVDEDYKLPGFHTRNPNSAYTWNPDLHDDQ